MKIDEDLIFEQLEKVRDALVKYAIDNLTREDLQNIIDMFPNPKGLIAEMKMEQIERDNDFYKDNDERIAKFDF